MKAGAIFFAIAILAGIAFVGNGIALGLCALDALSDEVTIFASPGDAAVRYGLWMIGLFITEIFCGMAGMLLTGGEFFKGIFDGFTKR